MSQINMVLQKRMKGGEKSKKMEEMAKQSASGNLSSFSGIFSNAELSDSEKQVIEAILLDYSVKQGDIDGDLKSLIALSSEVKAITTQALLLHGERIKRAQQILKNYREGAFTAWLIATYGNRQTPYNFLQYYELVNAMPRTLRPQIETMPRQAIYSLASREGDVKVKQQLIEEYRGETKYELLLRIRELFPLADDDKRKKSAGESTINALQKIAESFTRRKVALTKKEKDEIKHLLEEITDFVGR